MVLFHDKQKLAIGITHYVFRNTAVVEDNHSEGMVMDRQYYAKVHRVVKRKIGTLREFYDALMKIEVVQPPEHMIEVVPEEKRMRFCRFLMDVYFYSSYFGTDWDTPVLVADPIGDDLATYLLAGAFAACCYEARRLDDEVMCMLNRDICNPQSLRTLNAFCTKGVGDLRRPHHRCR